MLRSFVLVCIYMCSCVIVCRSSLLQSTHHLAKTEILQSSSRHLGLQQDKVRCVYVGEGRRERDCYELCSSTPALVFSLLSHAIPSAPFLAPFFAWYFLPFACNSPFRAVYICAPTMQARSGLPRFLLQSYLGKNMNSRQI